MHKRFEERIFANEIEGEASRILEILETLKRFFNKGIKLIIKSQPAIYETIDAVCSMHSSWRSCIDVKVDFSLSEETFKFSYKLEFIFKRSAIIENSKNLTFFTINAFSKPVETLIPSYCSQDTAKNFFNSLKFDSEDSDSTLIYPIIVYLREILPICSCDIVGSFLEGDQRKFVLQTSTEQHEIVFEIGELILLSRHFDEVLAAKEI
jgi:hypothetical protein